jgi:branched-chain amino acid aminotransferase
MEADFIWMNGNMVPWQDANIHVASHALHYGTGVFEGIRAYQTNNGPAIFRLKDHMQRLIRSGEYYYMNIPYTVDDLSTAAWRVVEENGFESCYIRPLAYRGLGQLGLYPRNCPVDTAIMAWRWGAYLGEEGLVNGIRATISPVQRFSDNMLPTKAKATGHYLNSILAKVEAHDRGYEEAIMLNSEGTLAEGSGENVFIVKGGVVYTPSDDSSILLGITRATVLEMCKNLGIPCSKQALTVEDIREADEIFVTGTAAEITPIRSVDDRPVADGLPGEITKTLQDLFFRTMRGEDTAFSHYLEYSGA